MAFSTYARNKGLEHYRFKSDGAERVRGIYHIKNVNNYHSRLKGWIQLDFMVQQEFNISYRYLTNRYAVTEIQNEKQFQEIFPFYITLGSGNDLVLWSTNKDVFSVEQREWKGNWEGEIAGTVVVKVEVDTSIFWIGYDGDYISVISNQSNFSIYEKIIKTFPNFVVPKLCEYE